MARAATGRPFPQLIDAGPRENLLLDGELAPS